MSTPPPTRTALEMQLAALGPLRNAGARSEEFRAWRQHTLTLLQRLWPGDSRPADRFKRIPFTPANARADATAVRQTYERGCGEAGVLLRELITRGPSATTAARADERAAEPSAPAERTEARDAAGGSPAPGPAAPAPLHAASAPTRPAAAQAHRTASHRHASPGVTPKGAKPSAAGIPAAVAAAFDPPPVPADAPAPAAAEPSSAEEFLSRSPIFNRPQGQAASSHAAVPRPAFKPVAQALIAAARDRELDGCGVPATHRPGVRTHLLALARAADSGVPRWSLVQGAVATVLEFPALAAQVLPLVEPFLAASAADEVSRRAA